MEINSINIVIGIVNFLSFQGLCQLFSSTCRTVYLVYVVVRSYGALAASFSRVHFRKSFEDGCLERNSVNLH